jgi:hypothetical protein
MKLVTAAEADSAPTPPTATVLVEGVGEETSTFGWHATRRSAPIPINFFTGVSPLLGCVDLNPEL